jgi:hypothetical protein
MNRSYSKIRHIQEVNQRLEKRLVENVITEADVNESNPIKGIVQSAVQGGKNLMKKAMGTTSKPWITPLKPETADEMVSRLVKAGASGSTARLLTKLGTLKMSDVLTRFLSPVRDEVVVALRDFKNIMSTLPQPKLPYSSNDVTTNAILTLRNIGDDLQRNLDAIQTPKGQTVDLSNIYLSLKEARKQLGGLDLTLQLDPANKRVFQIFQQNLDDAIVKFDDAIADIITK